MSDSDRPTPIGEHDASDTVPMPEPDWDVDTTSDRHAMLPGVAYWPEEETI